MVVTRNANEAMEALTVESVFSRSLESGSQFCVGVFGRNLVSVAMKMHLHLIYFTRTFYKCSMLLSKIMLQYIV
jgi:hypothetical protein